MSAIETYLWIAAGVAVAVVFPVLRAKVMSDWPKVAGIPSWVGKYARLLIFSLITALIVLAGLRAQDKALVKWWTAFLAGFAWESFVEKLGSKTLPA